MSSQRLGLLRMRGFGTGVCIVGCCSKVVEAVVWIGLEIHAKEKEKLHAGGNKWSAFTACLDIRDVKYHSCCVLLVFVSDSNDGNTKITHLLVQLHKTTK